MMTGNLTTLARPYARAAFETALDHNALAAWEGMLNSAAAMVQQDAVVRLLNSPDMTSKQLATLFCDVLARVLNPEMTHFIQLLAENKRLPILPDIAALFTALRMRHDEAIQVQLISAAAIDEALQQQFIKSLTKRLQKKVMLACEVDASLLGGAIIKASDWVFDGSIRGKLNRLLESL